MVSFWPWKRDDQSPASFEKSLSTLSTKIARTNGKLEGLRQQSRRFTGLWTLYSVFAYFLYIIILVLLVGWDKWGVTEYAAVTGGPLVIYFVRWVLLTVYNMRASKYQSQLDQLQKRRESTINQLKEATKYNTTQELLKRYGAAPPDNNKQAGSRDGQSSLTKKSKPQTAPKAMTGLLPPPTANIPRRGQPSLTSENTRHPSPTDHPSFDPDQPLDTSADFAPNAFPTVPQYAAGKDTPHWYDRILDVLLGDDETLPRNRLALICRKCRLVNGQAAPGTASLGDVGTWRCSACGTTNGEASEADRIIANLKQSTSSQSADEATKDSIEQVDSKQAPLQDAEHEDSDVTQYSDPSDEDETEKPIFASSTRRGHGSPRRRSARIREMSEDP